jgi:hypothetical protein
MQVRTGFVFLLGEPPAVRGEAFAVEVLEQ